MVDTKSLLHLDLDSEVFSSHSVDVGNTVSQITFLLGRPNV